MVTLAPGFSVPIDLPSFITSTWLTDVLLVHTTLPDVGLHRVGRERPRCRKCPQCPRSPTVSGSAQACSVRACSAQACLVPASGAGVDVEGEVGAAEYDAAAAASNRPQRCDAQNNREDEHDNLLVTRSVHTFFHGAPFDF